MVDDALDPQPALVAPGHVGQHCRVLYRYGDLIVEAVVDPALNLFLRTATAVHRNVERMMNVIAVFLCPQLLFKLFFCPGFSHSVISIPS